MAAWSTFTAEDVKRVPFSKQRKYIKFYERYLLLQSSEERGSEKAPQDKIDVLMKLYNQYQAKVATLQGLVT